MADCRKCRSLFIEALYDELDEQQKTWFEYHQRSCRECREAFNAFSTTLEVMDTRQVETPPPSFWKRFWKKLAPRLEEAGRTRSPTIGWWRRWRESFPLQPVWIGRLAGATALLIIGIFIGRLIFGPEGTDPNENRRFVRRSSGQTEFASLDDRTVSYIQKSKVLLLGIINFDPETEDVDMLNLDRQHQISETLVHEAGILKDELREPTQQRLRRLVEDLEFILIQIANLEAEHDLSAIDLVKNGIDRKALMMKINLTEMKRTEDNSEENNQATEETTAI